MSSLVVSDLQKLASSINDAVARSKELYQTGIDALKQALACDREAGEHLIQVKGSLPHGQFISWIEDNCHFTPRYAQMLMSVSKNWDKIMKGWEDKQDKSETGFAFEDNPLPSLKQALAIITTPKDKEEKAVTPVARPTQYKVASKGNDCYGEVVQVVEELHGGDVVKCKTSKGEFPFLKNELTSVDAELVIDAEIVEDKIEDNSEELREAIALIIEYLPQEALTKLLIQSLEIGKDHLPSDVYQSKVKLCQ